MSFSRGGPAFRIFGTRVKVGWIFPIVVLLLGYRMASDPIRLASWVVLVTISVLIHEAGHVVALRYFGHHPRVELTWMGGLTISEGRNDLTPRQSIIVSAAGPLTGIAFGALMEIAFGPSSNPYFHWLAATSFFVNVVWSLVNLVPVIPLDGGHIARELCQLASRRRPVAIAVAVLLIGSGIFATIKYVNDELSILAFIAVLLTMLNVAYLDITDTQKTRRTIQHAHEMLIDGHIVEGTALLVPILSEPAGRYVDRETRTTLAWALLHAYRYEELAQLDLSAVLPDHEPLLRAAIAWYHGDLAWANDLAAAALVGGNISPPPTYFRRVFLRLGELEALSQRIGAYPPEEALRGRERIAQSLAASPV
jgi:Zn-dependent protease